MPSRPRSPRRPQPARPSVSMDAWADVGTPWFALEVNPGLEGVARAEAERRMGSLRWIDRAAGDERGRLRIVAPRDPDRHRDLERSLLQLRTVHAVWSGRHFVVPRPKALLGDQARTTLVAHVHRVVSRRPGAFTAVRLHAAGHDTPVMRRLAATVAAAVGLEVDDADGDLHLRVVPGPGVGRDEAASRGWEVEVRITPRPCSTRPWRMVDLPGGLDACVAAAVWEIAPVRPRARILNLMCGGGTLLAERHLAGPSGRLDGVDLDSVALEAARRNLDAAGAVHARLLRGDATRTGLDAGSVDQIVVDPPWGDAVGARERIAMELPLWLDEAHRLLVPGGDLVVVTHAIRAFDDALASRSRTFDERGRWRVWQGGHWPAIVHLVKPGEG